MESAGQQERNIYTSMKMLQNVDVISIGELLHHLFPAFSEKFWIKNLNLGKKIRSKLC